MLGILVFQRKAMGIQGAKKVIFTACHSGKLKLTFTSPNIILNSSKKFICPSGKLITEFTSPIAKSTSPGLWDTTYFARWDTSRV